MSELKPITVTDECGSYSVYSKSDVDTVIEEKDRTIEFAKALTLKDIEIIKEKDKEIAELKVENERIKDELDAANNQCENLINSATDIMLRQDKANDTKCAEIEKLTAENRKLKRALYKACANWACAKMEYEKFDSNMFMCGFVTDKEVSWKSMMKKCQAKAEQYK